MKKEKGFKFTPTDKDKRIAELEKESNKLLDVINNQDVKIADLEKQIEEYKNGNFVQTVNQIIEGKDKQIEKMKCWCNCKNYLSCLEECCRKNISFEKGICYNCKKWEIKE